VTRIVGLLGMVAAGIGVSLALTYTFGRALDSFKAAGGAPGLKVLSKPVAWSTLHVTLALPFAVLREQALGGGGLLTDGSFLLLVLLGSSAFSGATAHLCRRAAALDEEADTLDERLRWAVESLDKAKANLAHCEAALQSIDVQLGEATQRSSREALRDHFRVFLRDVASGEEDLTGRQRAEHQKRLDKAEAALRTQTDAFDRSVQDDREHAMSALDSRIDQLAWEFARIELELAQQANKPETTDAPPAEGAPAWTSRPFDSASWSETWNGNGHARVPALPPARSSAGP
jgi:hypothetical protein